MTRYVALLRGINVGGNNLIKMIALKACFEEQGFKQVLTYIQSGNVLFTASTSRFEGEIDEDEIEEKLTRRIEDVLARTFNYKASVVLRSRAQMQDIIGRAPAGFGSQPDKYRYDVLYLKAPLTATAAIKAVPTNPAVDTVWVSPGKGPGGVLYFSRLISNATQSRLSKVASMPIYQSMTIRNWNTSTKLLRLMYGESGL